jgi:hypothetical protein
VRTFAIVFCYGSGSSFVTGTGTVINYGSGKKAKTCSGSATLVIYTADTQILAPHFNNIMTKDECVLNYYIFLKGVEIKKICFQSSYWERPKTGLLGTFLSRSHFNLGTLYNVQFFLTPENNSVFCDCNAWLTD